VQLQNGHFYDELGSWIAEYSSGLARVSPDKPRIVYIRECRRPERDAETFVLGYGDMSFRGAADSYSNGSGLFYDVTVDDRRKMVQKSVRLGRVVDRADLDSSPPVPTSKKESEWRPENSGNYCTICCRLSASGGGVAGSLAIPSCNAIT
jgi:hypothetical protein